MKSKSPFAKKSPLKVQVYGGDTYESPDTVITKTVGEQVGKAITGIADDAADYMDLKGKLAYDKKNPKTESKTRGGNTTNIYNYGKEDKLDSDSTRTEISEKQGGGGFSGQSAKDLLGRKLTSEESKWKDKEVKRLGGVQQYRDYYKIGEEKDKFHTRTTSKYKNDKKIFSTTQDLLKNPISMKGSPNKLIGDTVDPYGQINPGAVPTNQAKNDLGAQPIISADGSQPSARDIDVSAISNPYASPGADFNPSSKIKAQDIFGSPMQRQGLMNVGSPAHDKGHPNDYEGHTHRKKGASYKEGDYMDETDMETSYPKLHTQDVGEIKRDKKSQFMVSKNEDYNPTKIDTIRPLKGKEFKMGWGDAERNISTNPKYKKSK